MRHSPRNLWTQAHDAGPPKMMAAEVFKFRDSMHRPPDSASSEEGRPRQVGKSCWSECCLQSYMVEVMSGHVVTSH